MGAKPPRNPRKSRPRDTITRAPFDAAKGAWLMDDDICPKGALVIVASGSGGRRSSEDDYECGSCNLAYSISGSDWPAIEAGAETRLSRSD